MGLADRAWMFLPFSILTDAAVVFGNAKLGGLGGGHEIEDTGHANRTPSTAEAPRGRRRGIAFAGRDSFAGMVVPVDGSLGLRWPRSFLAHQVMSRCRFRGPRES